MTAQRISAFLLIGVELAILAYFSGTVAFPLLASAVALFGAVSTLRFRLSQRERFYVNCSVGLVFFFKYLIVPHTFHVTATMDGTPLAYGVGQIVIVTQVIQFFLDWPVRYRVTPSGPTGADVPVRVAGNRVPEAHCAGRLPLGLPVLGIVAFMCFANIRVTHQGRLVFQAMSIAYASCAAVFYGASRGLIRSSVKRYSFRRHALHLLVLTGASSLTWIAATNLYRHERDIDKFLAQFYDPINRTDLIGFSGMARLGSVNHRKRTGENRLVLRVFSDHTPGYLRGRVFDRLGRSEWFTSVGSRTMTPSQMLLASQSGTLENEQLVSLRKDAIPEQCREETCWPDTKLAGRYFTPLGTAHLKTSLQDILADKNGIFTSQGEFPGHPYTAFVCPKPMVETLSDAIRKCFLQLPEHLDGRVAALAARLFAECQTTQQKIDAVRLYFERNYEYAFGISVPADADPVTYFLLEKPAAHCEYFASGAALLLRLGQVPCRYVTGFVVSEKNDFGNYWIARNRDAHAWVEAYDDTNGWMIVETTPEAGMPSEPPPSEIVQFVEYLRDRFQQFRFRLQRLGLKELAQSLMFLLVSPLVIGFVVLVALVWLFVVWSKSRPQRVRSADPILNEFHRLLDRMDGRAKKQDFRRHAAETLTQFAQRIRTETATSMDCREMSQWYELYSSLRFGGQTTNVGLAKLKQSHAVLLRKL